MAIVLGLAAAITYGAADFVGGLVTRRANVLVVVLGSQLVGSVLLVALLPLIHGELTTRALAWGAVSGVAGATGIVFLYRGLARGRMSVIAPITAVEAAIVPVLFGLGFGERPGSLALIGVVVALGAITLVSLAPVPSGAATHAAPAGRKWRAPGVAEALGAGLSFGIFFVTLERAGAGAGLWPLVGARAASTVLVGAAVLIVRPSVRPEPGVLHRIALAGSLDVAANVFYLLAAQRGLLSVVAVLTSLYPASTVLLARVVLKERLSLVQVAGLGLAAAGVTLIAVG